MIDGQKNQPVENDLGIYDTVQKISTVKQIFMQLVAYWIISI